MKKTLGVLAVGAMFFPAMFIAVAADPQLFPAPTPDLANQQYPAPAPISTPLQNPIKYDDFPTFAAAVTKAAVQILLPFVVLAFIYSGFLFVKAQGNEEGLTKAKTAITYSLVGAFILLGAWGFAQIIGQTVSTLTK